MLMVLTEIGLVAASAAASGTCLFLVWRNSKAMDKRVSLLMQAALHAARQNNASAKAVSDRLGELMEQERENQAAISAAVKAVQRVSLRRAADSGLPIAPAGAANDAASRIAGADHYEHLGTASSNSGHVSIRRSPGIEAKVDGGAAAGRIRKLRSVEDFFGRIQAKGGSTPLAAMAAQASEKATPGDTYTRRMNKLRKTVNG